MRRLSEVAVRVRTYVYVQYIYICIYIYIYICVCVCACNNKPQIILIYNMKNNIFVCSHARRYVLMCIHTCTDAQSLRIHGGKSRLAHRSGTPTPTLNVRLPATNKMEQGGRGSGASEMFLQGRIALLHSFLQHARLQRFCQI